LSLFITLTLPISAWDKKDPRGFIQPGRRVANTIDLSSDQVSYSYRTFRVRVPEDAFKMDVKLDSAYADLDIYMNFDREIDNYDHTDYYSAEELFNEKLSVSRFSPIPLVPGMYYIDIVYPLDILPVIDNTIATEITFGLTVQFTSLDEHQPLTPDQPLSSSLSAEESMMKIFIVDIPEDQEVLRVDLFRTRSDLDMYIRYGAPAFTPEEADYIRESYLGQETQIISSESVRPLREGRYFISVFDRIEDNFRDDFSIIASFSEQAPDILTVYPNLPIGTTGLENALSATVEISTDTGSGSGCLVSPDGYIITGLHVITGTTGEVSDKIFASMNLSNFYPPQELFRVEIVHVSESEDLALLKIVSGLYDQPLPDLYDFPYFQLALKRPVSLGQPLSFLGYPQIGSEGSRASISLTKGIVSGFDTVDYGYLIKTDGEINSGNSGGAAINEDYVLIGFPMSVISDDGGQIAYIHPVELIPEEWLMIIYHNE
jgi:S1-C subfamily serine protease